MRRKIGVLFIWFILWFLFQEGKGEEFKIKVIEVKGTVEFRRSSQGKWMRLYKGAELQPGYEVRTRENSEAVISYGELGVSALSSLTYLKIQEWRRERGRSKISLFTSGGKVLSTIKKAFVPKVKFYLETPNALTGVRGTAYMVKYFPEREFTRIAVMEGEVAVQGKGKVPGLVIVKAMMATNVIRNEPPTPLEKIREEEIREWERWKERLVSVMPLWARGIIGAMAEIDQAQKVEAEMTMKRIERMRRGEKKVEQDFQVLEFALSLLYRDTGRIPTRKEGLKALLENPGMEGWNGPYLDSSSNLLDPYGKPYQYVVKKTPGGLTYIELRSWGADGYPGGYDDHVKVIFLKNLSQGR